MAQLRKRPSALLTSNHLEESSRPAMMALAVMQHMKMPIWKFHIQNRALDRPRYDGNFSQQRGERPTHRKRAGEHDREFDERREGWIVNDVLQPDEENEVQ